MPLIFLLTKNTPRSNLKIKSIMYEKKREWRKTVAAMLNHLLEVYPVSEEFVHCEQESKFFEDSCKFVGLRHELCEFREFLLNLNRYEEICSDL